MRKLTFSLTTKDFLLFSIVCFLSTLSNSVLWAQNTKAFTIVLDPGHGGHDCGAKGKHSLEKEITLSICQKIESLIQSHWSDVMVELTRRDDDFIALNQRTAFANELSADLFVSVHCNALSVPHVRGTETYVMGTHKTDANLSIVHFENASAENAEDQAVFGGFEPESPEAFIIMSQWQASYFNQSMALAQACEQGFASHHPGGSHGVKQAGFFVLYKTKMPSILTEVGFLTNHKDEQYLMSQDGQWEIANNLFKAIEQYRSNYKPTTQLISLEQVQQIDSSISYKILLNPDNNAVTEQSLDGILKFHNLEIVSDEDILQYYVSSFPDLNSAEQWQRQIAAMGFPNTQIIGFQN